MNLIPQEFVIGGVYFPPLLIAGILGVLAAALTAMLLKRYRFGRWGQAWDALVDAMAPKRLL